MFVKVQHVLIKRMLVLEFSCICFKTSLSHTRANTKVNDALKTRCSELAEILDCTIHTAREIISRNKDILNINSEDFRCNAKFCSQYFKFSDVVEFPILISLNSSLLQHRYFSLLELGCHNITASIILKYLQVIKKTPAVLHREGLYFYQENSLEVSLNLFPDSDSIKKFQIKSRIEKLFRPDNNLFKIKEAMNAEFLACKLDFPLNTAHQMFCRYPPLRTQSIKNTSLLLDVLFQRFSFPISKIFYMPSLLSLHHESVINFLEEIPSILGVNTMQVTLKLPLLLKRSKESVQEMEIILKKFKITDKQLLSCPKITAIANCTLQTRLKFLCHSKEFALLKTSKDFLWLVFHFNRLKTRLESLQATDVPYTLRMFMVSDQTFDKYIRFSKAQTHIKDTVNYLAFVFNCTEEDMLMKLREFPNIHNSNISNASKVVEYLLNVGVTKQQLLDGLGIILYDIDLVKVYFTDLPNHPACQPFSEWMSHDKLIHLLMYVIEADTGFKAIHLYRTRLKLDGSEELNFSCASC